MLWRSNEAEQVVNTSESGTIAVLANGTSLVGLEDVKGEATQARKHAGVGANAGMVFAEGDIATVM